MARSLSSSSLTVTDTAPLGATRPATSHTRSSRATGRGRRRRGGGWGGGGSDMVVCVRGEGVCVLCRAPARGGWAAGTRPRRRMRERSVFVRQCAKRFFFRAKTHTAPTDAMRYVSFSTTRRNWRSTLHPQWARLARAGAWVGAVRPNTTNTTHTHCTGLGHPASTLHTPLSVSNTRQSRDEGGGEEAEARKSAGNEARVHWGGHSSRPSSCARVSR